MALILSHNCTLRVWPDMIRLSMPGQPRKTEAGKRCAVKVFSEASRKRLFEFMHQIEFYLLVFVSLTYPRVFPADGKEVKKHLRRFRARIERKFGKLRIMWRLEYQDRGAPHFHLLVMDPPFICKMWLSRAWYHCVGSNDPKHFRYGTRIESVAKKGENGKVFAYVGKYLGKTDQSERKNSNEWTGRYWGKWNIETPLPIEFEVSYGEAVRAASVVISSRGDHNSFIPGDVVRCRVFGGGVGRNTVGNAVVREVKKHRERNSKRKLDGRDRFDVD